jgi:hypothetical protein
MKLPFFRRSDAHKPRPYWHVDAKWVCAILLGAALAVTLPVAAAHRLTAREHATELLAYTMAGLTSPNGIDDAEGLDEVKERVKKKGSETVKIAGLEVVFTAKDFETLSPRELRLKVFSAFAERLYDQGARRLAEAQGLDKAAVDKAVKDASMLNLFSQETHKRVGTILVWLVLLDLLLLAALVFFSNRFGRLVSPGLVMLLVGLPGLLFWAIASQNPEVAGAARSEDPESNLAALNLFASYVGPLIVPHFAAAYLFVLRTGLLLLGLAITGRIVYSVIKHRTKAHEHKSTEAETNDKKITS